jgi:hypothetical protein
MRPRPAFKIPGPWRVDWRGWITLAWVLWWGWAYAAMALHARGPQVLAWVRALAKWAGLS